MIRILLDECLPVKLRFRLQEVDDNFYVSTVTAMQWTGMKNGELLERVQKEFDIFITMDQNLPYQQSLTRYSLAIIGLKSSSNRYEDLLPLIKSALRTIKKCRPGDFYSLSR